MKTIYNHIIKHEELKPIEKIILLVILDSNEKGLELTVKKISQLVNITERRTVSVLSELQDKGFLKINKERKINSYSLLKEKL